MAATASGVRKPSAKGTPSVSTIACLSPRAHRCSKMMKPAEVPGSSASATSRMSSDVRRKAPGGPSPVSLLAVRAGALEQHGHAALALLAVEVHPHQRPRRLVAVQEHEVQHPDRVRLLQQVDLLGDASLEAGALAEADRQDLDGADGLRHVCSPHAAGSEPERLSARAPRQARAHVPASGCVLPQSGGWAGWLRAAGAAMMLSITQMSPTDLSAELVWVLAVDDQRPFREAAHRVVDATAGLRMGGRGRLGRGGGRPRARARARHRDHGRPDAGHGRHRGGAAGGRRVPTRRRSCSCPPSRWPARPPTCCGRAPRRSRASRPSGPRCCACSSGVRTRAPSPEPWRPCPRRVLRTAPPATASA